MVEYWNAEAETMPRDKLEKLQGEKLQKLAKYVYENVDFYKRKFDEAGIKPEDIQSVGDIKKLPLTLKTDLRDHYPFKLNATPLEDVIRIHASSGTTGRGPQLRSRLSSTSTTTFRSSSIAVFRAGRGNLVERATSVTTHAS